MGLKIALAPMQGYTDWVFRKVYSEYFKGIDEYLTPFLIVQNDGRIRNAHIREVEPYNERSEKLTPQFAASTIEEFNFFISYFRKLGYSKLNWNMGCPFPMLAKKKKGCALLQYPELIEEILASADLKDIELTVKARLGYDNNENLDSVISILNKYNIPELIIHPRTGKQQYKGIVDMDSFYKYAEKSTSKISYNGDLLCVDDYKNLKGDIDSLMIGRGVLKDLWLPAKLKSLDIVQGKEATDLFRDFHNKLFDIYSELLCGDQQILLKMKSFWEYFSFNFSNQKKVHKAIKKSGNLAKYKVAVNFALQQGIAENTNLNEV